MNPQELPPDQPRVLQLPPAALVQGHELASAPGLMHAELRAHRAEYKYDQTLLAARQMIAEQNITMRYFRDMFAPGSLDRGTILENGTSVRNDMGPAAPFARVILQALGQTCGADDLVRRTGMLQPDEEIRLDSGHGYALSGEAFHHGRAGWRIELSPGLEKPAAQAALDHFTETFRQLTQKYAHAWQEISDGLRPDQPTSYSAESFVWQHDADAVLSLMEGPTPIHTSDLDNPTLQRAKFIEALYELPAHHGEEQASQNELGYAGIYFNEKGGILKALIPTRIPGVYFGMRAIEPGLQGDINEIPFHLGVEVKPEETYRELDYHSKYRENTTPFVESVAAAQLLGSFEKAGLQLSDSLTGIITETRLEKRFGHAYATVTREVAKLVNNRSYSLDRLFDTSDGAAEDKIRALQSVDDPAAQVVIDLLKGIVDRTPEAPGQPNLPTSEHMIDMRDGSCKDIEVYFDPRGRVTENEVALHKSTYKVPRYITMQPVYLNGVRLPAGTLLAKENDGYLMLRVTGFAFANNVALDAFGPQEAENRASGYGGLRPILRQQLQS